MEAPNLLCIVCMPPRAPIPKLLYGTAWKEERTEALTAQALACGFRGIDTANQRKHYFEAAVGKAVRAAVSDGAVRRGELFLQSKFTFRDGQDHRLPYDAAAPIATQVRQSFESSLEHFGTDYLDSLVLHGPSSRGALTDADREAWRAMEALGSAGRTRFLGVSNFTASQLTELLALAKVPPRFVQNRCYARRGWDRDVRRVCTEHSLIYQGFSLLTANRTELERAPVRRLASKLGRSIPELVFAFCRQIGMLPLTGTSSPEHMRLDLASVELELEPADLAMLESVAL
jgi:diketogulonate reductase-like aldo/keto reductase